MHEPVLRTRGSLRYSVNEKLQKRDWTSALLNLFSDSESLIVADLQEAEYECLDIPESKIVIPLKHFRVCRKKSCWTQQSQMLRLSTIDELLKGTGVPVFQIYLCSRIIFAKKHLWIGFDNHSHQELWYKTLKPIVSRSTRLKYTAKDQPIMRPDKVQSDKATRQSELDLLASALPIMLDNEIYESLSIHDAYAVVVIQTEKSKELGLFGRYLFRVTATSFDLLHPLRETVVHFWTLKFVRKFGVHMGRLYLIAGAGCQGGKGLYIFLVEQPESLQRKLLLLGREGAASSTVSRRLPNIHVGPSLSIQDTNELLDTMQSMGYWFQSERVSRPSLFSPMPPGQGTNTSGRKLNDERWTEQQTKFMKDSTTNGEVRMNAMTSNETLHDKKDDVDFSIEKSAQTSLEYESTDISEVADNHNQLEAIRCKFVGNDTTKYSPEQVETINGLICLEQPQPLYENTEQWTDSLHQEKSADENALSSGDTPRGTERSQKFSFPELADMEPLTNRTRENGGSWRLAYLFEPIEETEEHISCSDSQTTLKHHEEEYPIVTSSTQDCDVDFNEFLDDYDQEVLLNDEVEMIHEGRLRNSSNGCSNVRRNLGRSITWNGWIEGSKRELVQPIVHDAVVQTDTDAESTCSGSHGVARTKL